MTLWPAAPTASDRISVEVDARDPDRDSLEIEIEWYLNGILEHAGPELMLPAVELKRGDQVYAVAYVRDAESEVILESDSVRVANQAPYLVSLELAPGEAGRGDNLMVVARAEDPEGDPIELRYEWYINDSFVEDVSGAVLSPGRFRRGDLIWVRVTPSDGVDAGRATESAKLAVHNSAPIIVSEPSYELAGEALYEYKVVAKDPDGDHPLRYELARAPAGMKIDLVTGLITWTVPDHAAGLYEIELTVTDPYGGAASQRYSIDIAWEEPAPAAPDAEADQEQADAVGAP